MFLALPKDVAWPPELPVYGSTGGATRQEKELPSLGEGMDGMELVWPKYASCQESTLITRRADKDSWPKDLPSLDVIEVSSMTMAQGQDIRSGLTLIARC